MKLTKTQLPVVLEYVDLMIRQATRAGCPSWEKAYLRTLESIKARIEANPQGPVALSEAECDAVVVMSQDLVSRRAGPGNKRERTFFAVLNRIERTFGY